jgi:menaquinone-specific isochorismate synthase
VSALRFSTVAVEDPGDLLTRVPDAGGFAWVHRGEGLVGWGEVLRLETGPGDDRFARAAAGFARLVEGAVIEDEVGVPGSGPVAFASFTFDAHSGGSVLVVPRVVLGRRDGRAWWTVAGERGGPGVALGPVQALPSPARVRYEGSLASELDWIHAVATATSAIGAGELSKVVLARDLGVWSEEPLDARALARRLAERFPECYTFACAGLVGATPELLVRRTADAVESLCLAGTARRGSGAAEDAAIGRALLASPKESAEHDIAVASVRDALAPLLGDLHVGGPWLLRLANVQHIATTVRGHARSGATALDLAAALHPTAAVCGTPTGAALGHIRELERFDRGRYAGPVGWTDARGDGEFGIALRCALLDGTRARLYAGSGIVADSLPEAELEETRLKLRAMQSALAAER